MENTFVTVSYLCSIAQSIVVLVLAVAVNLFNTGQVMAAEFDLPTSIARVKATEVRVSLGNAANELKFFPNSFEFAAGRTYKLLLNNPSPQKHYFTAKDFADASWTRKVEAGNVEIKGAIHELELKPGAEAEWVFVPEKPGTYNLRCTIPGHTEAGMTGRIRIVAPQQSA
ncbi:MAG: copper-binding protein [Cyanobacteria bacterium SID2]|nr:copper-binding protein [Cyanobacteria bacterium SID2]MBP0005358.1 copper-binding protein [Cyanobacteria bacterium SBC]